MPFLTAVMECLTEATGRVGPGRGLGIRAHSPWGQRKHGGWTPGLVSDTGRRELDLEERGAVTPKDPLSSL